MSSTTRKTTRSSKRSKVQLVDDISNDDVHSIIKRNKSTNQKMANEPDNWKQIYDNIAKMRSKTLAAVDTMGCDKCYDTNVNDKQRRFQILVALMLSSQTRDEITFATMSELRKKNLSVEFINEISDNELMELLKSVGFYRRKTEYLKKTARILKEQYDGDIPHSLEELVKLPGVGPKMAHLAMKSAWNEITGIGVDTHVHRICNRLRWVNKTKTPEETRIELEAWLPKEYWRDINHLLVGFGQSICLPIKPKCDICLNNKICPSTEYSF